MSNFDGSKFGGVDESAYQDGRPMDEALRRKIESNRSYIERLTPPVVVQRRGGDIQPGDAGDFPGDRAICSLDPTIFVQAIVWVDASTTQVVIGANLRSDGTSGEVYIGGRVVWAGQPNRILGTLDEVVFDDDLAFDETGITEFKIDVNSGSSEGYALAYLTVRSTLDTTVNPEKVSNSSFNTHAGSTAQLYWSGFPVPYDPDTSPDPDHPLSLDHCVLVNDTYGGTSDLLAIGDAGGGIVRALAPNFEVGTGVTLSSQFGVQRISYVQMRSWYAQTRHRADITGPELRAGIAESGIESMRQGQRIKAIADRPRLLAAGPQGWRPEMFTPDRSAFQGRHHNIWRYTFGRANPEDLVRAFIPEYRDYGFIECLALLAGHWHEGQYQDEPDGGTVDWDFELTVDGFVGSPGVETLTLPVTTHATQNTWNARLAPTDINRWLPLITRCHWEDVNGGSTNGLYAIKEGQIRQDELRDLTAVRLRVPVPAGVGIGHSVQLAAEVAAGGPNIQGLSGGKNLVESQSLTCLAWSVLWRAS